MKHFLKESSEHLVNSPIEIGSEFVASIQLYSSDKSLFFARILISERSTACLSTLSRTGQMIFLIETISP